MRSAFIASIFGVLLVALPAGQSGSEPPRRSASLERPFAPGGAIRMNLSAGEYLISGGADNRINVSWKVRHDEDLPRARVHADVTGSAATLSTDGVRDGFKAEIQVPTRSGLHVRLTAGELTVEGIDGSKDIELHAGELTIDVGRIEDYGRVDAALWAGDLDARPFNVSKDGLFRSFEWKGTGPYTLHAHLKAGDLRLRSRQPSARD
jgi:hypothetical protein